MIYLGNGIYSNSDQYLCHHGIKGQRWGVKNGPPYPLDKYRTAINKHNKERINDIYKSMSKRDKKFIYGGEESPIFYGEQEYDKSGMTLYSAVLSKKGTDHGFITIAKIPEDQNVDGTRGAEVAIGVRGGDEYRGKGTASKLVKKSSEWFDNQNTVDVLWWKPDAKNIASIKTALKNGYYKDELGDGYIMSKNSRKADHIAKTFSDKVKNDSKDPVGNQNCMLCTWCAELNFRGKNVKPRPVYSPRDIIFQRDESKIVKNANKKGIKSIKDVEKFVQSQPYGSRFYTHVNWKGSSGGHEFLLINDIGNVRVLDAQSGTHCSINDPDGKYYFTDINPKNSYMFRIDDKPLNNEYIKLNNKDYILQWNESKDIPYMKKHGMI